MLGRLKSNLALIKTFPETYLVHGASDIAVHPEQSVRAAAELTSLGVKNSLTIVPGAGHAVPMFEDGRYIVEAYEFLNRKLGISVQFTATAEERELLHRDALQEALSF